MNRKISTVIIVFLLGVIGYQSGIVDSFSHKGIKCDSPEALNLAKEIAIEKAINPMFNIKGIEVEYNIENFNFNMIITKKYDKDTGYHECTANSEIIGNFNFNKTAKPKVYFNIFLGSEKVISLGNNQYKIISPIWYSTEVTDDKKQYYVNLKFNGDKTKFLK